MNRKMWRNILILSCASSILASVTYGLDLWTLSAGSYVTPTEAAFMEGVLYSIIGVLLLLGSEGLNRASQRAAALVASAGAISGDQPVGPSEIFRRDAWKPKGYARLGLTLIIAGILLVIVYFVTLYTA